MGKIKTILNSAASLNDDEAVADRGIEKLFKRLDFDLTEPRNASWLQQTLLSGSGPYLAKLDGLATALRAAPALPVELDEKDVKYVAQQRALRSALVALGRITEPLPKDIGSIKFSITASENRLIDLLTVVWLESFRFGLALAASREGAKTRRKTQRTRRQ